MSFHDTFVAKRGPKTTVDRMVMFDNGLVLVSQFNDGSNKHMGQSQSLLLEPHGATFTYIAKNRTHSRHLSKFAPSVTHTLLRAAILFRNTHATEPFFCPETFTLLSILHPDPRTRRASPVRIDRAHWPVEITKQYCHLDDDDAVHVGSVGSHTSLSLSPHQRVVRVTFPVSLPVLKTETEQRYFHIEVSQIFPVQNCPETFAHPLKLAMSTVQCLEKGAVGTKAEGYLDTPLPRTKLTAGDELVQWTVNAHDICNVFGATWKEHVIELSTDTKPLLAVPTARPVVVEWTPEYTLWPGASAAEKGAKACYCSVGVVMHGDDTYLHVTGEKSEDGPGSGYVHAYRIDGKGEYQTYTCAAAPVEYASVLRYVDHLRRSQAALEKMRVEPFTEPEGTANGRAPISPIERYYNAQDRKRNVLQAGIARYNDGKQSMDAIMQQTRRYLERQNLHEETGEGPVG